MDQQVKDPALLLLWRGFSPGSGIYISHRCGQKKIMLNEFSKTICACTLVKSLYPRPEKLQLSHFPSQLLEILEIDTASHERVVEA